MILKSTVNLLKFVDTKFSWFVDKNYFRGYINLWIPWYSGTYIGGEKIFIIFFNCMI